MPEILEFFWNNLQSFFRIFYNIFVGCQTAYLGCCRLGVTGKQRYMITAVIVHDLLRISNFRKSIHYPPAGIELALEIFMITAVIVLDLLRISNFRKSIPYPPAGIELALDIFIPILNPTP